MSEQAFTELDERVPLGQAIEELRTIAFGNGGGRVIYRDEALTLLDAISTADVPTPERLRKWAEWAEAHGHFNASLHMEMLADALEASEEAR